MDRHQLALECQEVERLGGSVRDFLRGRGAVSPWGTWYRLQIEELGRKNAQITEGVEKELAWKQILTKEARAEVERMIEAGEDPKPFLEKAGSKNPSAHEYMIRRQMEKKKAEGIPKPPKDKPQPRPQSEVRTVPAEDGVPPVVSTMAPMQVEKPKKPTKEPADKPKQDTPKKAEEPISQPDVQILRRESRKTGIEYSLSDDRQRMVMGSGGDLFNVSIEQLPDFLQELPPICRQLGVKV